MVTVATPVLNSPPLPAISRGRVPSPRRDTGIAPTRSSASPPAPHISRPHSASRAGITVRRIAEYRKAIVSGVGAIAAVVISVKDPLGSVLPAGATPWLAVGVAVLTALATYLATNAGPADDSTPSPEAVDAAPENAAADEVPLTAAKPQINTAIAGLALVAGGLAWAGLRRGRSGEPVRLALLLRTNDFHSLLSDPRDRSR